MQLTEQTKNEMIQSAERQLGVIDRKRFQAVQVFLLFLFIVSVLWYTVLKRSTSFHFAQTELFWSYRLWLSGDWKLGREILGNIVMFLPFGFLTASVSEKRTGFSALAAALLFSLAIEVLQLVLMRGLFEWDDIVNNAVGALIGWVLYKIIAGHLPQGLHSTAVISFSIICVCVYMALFGFGRGEAEELEDSSSRSYCFQIDTLNIEENMISLSGFELVYGKKQYPITIVLMSQTTGKTVPLHTRYGLDRPDVNEYFSCDFDYTKCGFSATGEIREDEYEVMIKYPWTVPAPTGVYVGSAGVSYVSAEQLAEPDLHADFVENGVLRVSRPDVHCWVYQHQGALYWIADRDFRFEDDGTTYIQFQLWTTQTERLPENRLANGHLWDNIGGTFEDHELEGDFGEYRVMRRKIPTDYSITSIVTGYYKNGEWIWKNYFRPIYEFDGLRA